MTVATVTTEGYGSFGSIPYVTTDGYDIGAATNVIACITTEGYGSWGSIARVTTDGYSIGTTPPPPGGAKAWINRARRRFRR